MLQLLRCLTTIVLITGLTAAQALATPSSTTTSAPIPTAALTPPVSRAQPGEKSVPGASKQAVQAPRQQESQEQPRQPQSGSQKAKSPSGFIHNHYVLTAVMKMNGYHPQDPTLVIVDKGSHDTYVLQLQNKQVVRVLTISNAIGSTEKPTPPGRYSVLYKKKFPTWIPPVTIDKKQKPVPPYNQTHKNPLGVAAIFLNKDQLALHGTNDPREIRKSVSHGCIRHSNQDISKLYAMVDKGDRVIIIRRFKGTVLNRSDFVLRHKKSA